MGSLLLHSGTFARSYSQGQILAERILAAKLPNSDLNFAVDFPPVFQGSGSSARGRCRRGRSEIPHFCSKLQLFALVKNEEKRRTKKEKRRKAKKSEEREEKRKKTKKRKRKRKQKSEEKRKKKRESSSDPIYTNPIKNLPNLGKRPQKTTKKSPAKLTRKSVRKKSPRT